MDSAEGGLVNPVRIAFVVTGLGTGGAEHMLVKLLEAGTMVSQCDEVWVVTARPEVQLRRLREVRGMSEEDARQRMQMQSPQAAKINQADRVIDNSGTLAELHAQLDAIWADLKVAYPKRMARLNEISGVVSTTSPNPVQGNG